MKYITGAKIITDTEVLENHVLGFEEEIGFTIPKENFNPLNKQIINANGLFAAPGLIDLHIHGSGNCDTMAGTVEDLNTISSSIVKNGVTAFLATTMTMEPMNIEKALEAIRTGMKKKLSGAQLIGAHMEGPFINESFKGAQDAQYIIAPDFELTDRYSDVIKLVTLAPELPGALELTERLKEKDIVVSAGHSAASYAEMLAGIEAGISHCTHLFNAMTGLHHRKPGVALAALTKDIYCELIADKIHVHPGIFELVYKTKGPDRITLITDCIEAGGMPEGQYSLGGQKVCVRDGSARLSDGTLAGSILNLNEGLKNFYENTGANICEVFRMGSLNPARELRIDDKKGSIASGKDADFFLMDEEFNVRTVFIKGRCVFNDL